MNELSDYVETTETVECGLICSRSGCTNSLYESYHEIDYLDASRRISRKAEKLGWRTGRNGPVCPKHKN